LCKASDEIEIDQYRATKKTRTTESGVVVVENSFEEVRAAVISPNE
jgi:hypothetical protein